MKIDPFKVEEWMNKFEIGATALVHYDFWKERAFGYAKIKRTGWDIFGFCD